MRLLVLSSHLFPNYKNPNAGSFVVEQVRHLSKHCDITVFVPHPWVPPFFDKLSAKWRRYKTLPFEETIAGVRVLHPRRIVLPKINSWVWMTFSVALSYWHCLRTADLPNCRPADFDIVEGQFAIPDGFAAAWLGQKFGKPSVVHVHGTDVHTIPNESRLQKRLVRWTISHADAVRAVSGDLAKQAKELMETGKRGNGETGRIWVVPNGVDVDKFSMMPREEARRRLGLDEHKRYLLYVGRLVPVKGLDLLLNAAAIVLKHRPDIDLLLVGDGYERANLQRLAEQLGIAQRVRFVGSQPHDRIALWMNVGDVFCLLSHKEGLPTVLIEALACGTPVVATAVGGIPEIVADGQVGRLVHSRNPEEAATRILEVLDADWDRGQLRQHAMRFSYERVMERLLEMYRSVMSRHPLRATVVRKSKTK